MVGLTDECQSWLGSCNFGYSKQRYYTIQAANNKDADQTAHLTRKRIIFFSNQLTLVKSQRNGLLQRILKRHLFDKPLMNSLKVNCLAMELVARH